MRPVVNLAIADKVGRVLLIHASRREVEAPSCARRGVTVHAKYKLPAAS